MMRSRYSLPILKLTTAVRLEALAGSSHMPDVEADLAYAARLLREDFGQCPGVIAASQEQNVATAHARGARDASGQVTHRPGWARPKELT